MIQLNINGERYAVDVEPETPLLWVIREQVGLTGTKYGCGAGRCGACTVHIDGHPVRSCDCPSPRRSARASRRSKVLPRATPAQSAAGLVRERCPSVRLLPVRHDHGGCGAARPETEADRRRHRCRDHQYLSLRYLSAGARGHPHGGQGVGGDDDRYAQDLAPRLYRCGCRGRWRSRDRHQSIQQRCCGSCCGRFVGNHRLGGDPPQRHCRRAHRTLRDGPGLAHRARPTSGRGARVQLEQGDLGISHARHQPRAQEASGDPSGPAEATVSAARRSTCARAVRRRA